MKLPNSTLVGSLFGIPVYLIGDASKGLGVGREPAMAYVISGAHVDLEPGMAAKPKLITIELNEILVHDTQYPHRQGRRKKLLAPNPGPAASSRPEARHDDP